MFTLFKYNLRFTLAFEATLISFFLVTTTWLLEIIYPGIASSVVNINILLGLFIFLFIISIIQSPKKMLLKSWKLWYFAAFFIIDLFLLYKIISLHTTSNLLGLSMRFGLVTIVIVCLIILYDSRSTHKEA